MSLDRVADAPTIAVTAVGAAAGARAAAAALACAGADVDRPSLLVEIGGRAPRPTLLTSRAAQRLEERLVAHLPQARIAARGQLCQLAVGDDAEGIEVAGAAVTVARGALAVLSLPPNCLQSLLSGQGAPRPSGVMLRADVAADRPLVALVVRGLLARDLRVAVLKQPLSWVSSRRALFGALQGSAPGGLPAAVLRKLREGSSHPERPPAGISKQAWDEETRSPASPV
jgi:hypothetical protein